MLKANNLRQLWGAHRVTILRVAITVMAIAALVWLGYQFWRLLFQSGKWGAIDLLNFRREVLNWFSPASGETNRGFLYPPATFVLLFPLVGWLVLIINPHYKMLIHV